MRASSPWPAGACLASTEGPAIGESTATREFDPASATQAGGGALYSAEFSGDAAFLRLMYLLGSDVVHDSLVP